MSVTDDIYMYKNDPYAFACCNSRHNYSWYLTVMRRQRVLCRYKRLYGEYGIYYISYPVEKENLSF